MVLLEIAPNFEPDVIVSRAANMPLSRIDDAYIAVDRNGGFCYSMNATTARIWELIASPKSVASICDSLCAEFDVDRAQCEQDVSSVLVHFREVGLIK